jgi:hypothetical protein
MYSPMMFLVVLQLREIKHQIDIISKAIILNRLAYISNLNETNELQMQVDELIAKGYLRESMRTFMVPVFLVQKKNVLEDVCELRGCVWIARM